MDFTRINFTVKIDYFDLADVYLSVFQEKIRFSLCTKKFCKCAAIHSIFKFPIFFNKLEIFRRYIWYLKKAFPLSSVVSYTYADYILHTILQ